VSRPLAAEGPNAEQIAFWNDERSAKWVTNQERLDALIEPFGERAMDDAAVASGERALDIGCGCGATSLALGERVGPDGSVLGVDISAPMLDRAAERAGTAGLAHVRFENADAQSHAFEPGGRDLVFSRFGIMFFADPTRAFTNLRAALRPGGRVAFVCWRAIPENAWVSVPIGALTKVIAPPQPPAPGAPGPFSLADSDRVREILSGAGFEAIDIEAHDEKLVLGEALEEAVEFSLSNGPASRLMQDATAEQRTRATEVVRAALAPHARDGGVALAGAAWRVLAWNPR
jgi:SAM-dependent methyltransferase